MLADIDADTIAGFPSYSPEKIAQLSQKYKVAAPFPHIVIDHLFNERILVDIIPEFESKSGGWTSFRSQMQVKLATVAGATLPPAAQVFFDLAYSGPFLRLLSRITGIRNLIPDWTLFGGGMHEVPEGGHFQPHVDFRTHPTTGLTNRIAVITYLNPGWQEADGGALELWRTRPAACVTPIVPVLGRTVIMGQSEEAIHGHPQPVRSGLRRRAVIAYYYTADEAAAVARAETGYIVTPDQTMRQRAEVILRMVSPPLALNVLRAASGKLRATPRLSLKTGDASD